MKETQNKNLQTFIILKLQSFAVLREKIPEDHVSRFEAYCDLIDRAQCQNMRLDRGASKAELRPGEVMLTYTELAEQWHWTRVNVRRFIEDLENAGLAVKRPFMKNFIIMLPIHVLPESLAEKLPDQSIGSYSNSKTHNQSSSIAEQKTEEDAPVTDVERDQDNV